MPDMYLFDTILQQWCTYKILIYFGLVSNRYFSDCETNSFRGYSQTKQGVQLRITLEQEGNDNLKRNLRLAISKLLQIYNTYRQRFGQSLFSRLVSVCFHRFFIIYCLQQLLVECRLLGHEIFHLIHEANISWNLVTRNI